MQLVLPDGRVLAGADAAPEILRRIPRWRWIASFFALPGARPVARRVYGWIARNRMRLSCGLRGGASPLIVSRRAGSAVRPHPRRHRR